MMSCSKELIPRFPLLLTPLDYNSATDTAADSKLELLPLHSPLLRQSSLISFPPLSNMLKFSGWSCLISDAELKEYGFYLVKSKRPYWFCMYTGNCKRPIEITVKRWPIRWGVQRPTCTSLIEDPEGKHNIRFLESTTLRLVCDVFRHWNRHARRGAS